MERLIRKHLKAPLTKGSKRQYYEEEYLIYTEEEAKELKIEYKPWYECSPGEYGLSDDGYVAICIKRKDYKDKGTSSFTFPYGQAMANWRKNRDSPYQKLLYLPHKSTGSFSSISPKPFWESNKRKAKYKNFVKYYVYQFVNGNINYRQLGRIFDRNEPMPAVKAKALLEKQYIKEMIDEELQTVLSDKGVTQGDIIDMLLLAAKMAEEKKDAANLLRTAENFMKIFGMAAKAQKHMEFEGEYTELSEIEQAVALEERREKELRARGEEA